MTDEAASHDADAEVAPDEVETKAGEAADAEADATDPDELMKQKYRDAMAHKHGASGAAKQGHGDAGTSGHSQSAGPSQRLFRRKSGG
jgi:hypothetical protein